MNTSQTETEEMIRAVFGDLDFNPDGVYFLGYPIIAMTRKELQMVIMAIKPDSAYWGDEYYDALTRWTRSLAP